MNLFASILALGDFETKIIGTIGGMLALVVIIVIVVVKQKKKG